MAGGNHEGHERREDARGQRVPERLRQRVAAAVGARLGQAAATRGENDARGADRRPSADVSTKASLSRATVVTRKG